MLNKENVKGKLIVFEGLDFAFKETNSKALYEYIKCNLNDKVELISFPQYDEQSSYFVKQYLGKQYGDIDNISPYTAAIFYAVDRYESILKLDIRRKLKEGYTIIMDRYVGSNLIYGGARFKSTNGFNTYLKWVIDLEFCKNELPKPDITLFMKLPFNLVKDKLKERQDKAGISKDLHESNLDYLSQVYDISDIVSIKMRWERVICNEDNTILSKEAIFSNILSILDRSLV